MLPKRYTDLPPPESIVEAATLQSYETHGAPVQDLLRPQLAWHKPWTFSWNRGMLYMLAEQFLTEIRDGSRALVPDRRRVPLSNTTQLKDHVSMLTVSAIQTLIQNKLRRAHSLVLAAAKTPDQAQFRRERQQYDLARAARERRASRRKLVHIYSVSSRFSIDNLFYSSR